MEIQQVGQCGHFSTTIPISLADTLIATIHLQVATDIGIAHVEESTKPHPTSSVVLRLFLITCMCM